MPQKLYVGNLPHAVNDQDLVDWVTNEGFKVETARVIRDRATGQSRGFGFVELTQGEDLAQSIARLSGMQWEGRTLQVNEARPEAGPRGGGRDFSGGRGGAAVFPVVAADGAGNFLGVTFTRRPDNQPIGLPA